MAKEGLAANKSNRQMNRAKQIGLGVRGLTMKLSVSRGNFPTKKADRTKVLSALYLIKRLNASLFKSLPYFMVGW